jgi:hypothetical protein
MQLSASKISQMRGYIIIANAAISALKILCENNRIGLGLAIYTSRHTLESQFSYISS